MSNLEEYIDNLRTSDWIVMNLKSFDEFMDWLDIDIGIDRQDMLDGYIELEKLLRDDGYPVRANLVKHRIKNFKKEFNLDNK